ncbi:MAG: helix-turn-helix transcriptional regulator [Cyclobacteriaceae bacterium]|nr:helix-turn-helix transcriptional regulator [Cyclobacteriaceae bacterium]
MLKLGKKLKEMRLEKNYSQEYLAHELGMTQGNYCKLESDHHFPSAETLEKLASLYDTTPHDLMSGEGQQQIQYNHESPHAVNAYMVWQEPQKLVEELLASKEKIITLQAKQIELLESQLKQKGT